MTSTGLTYFSSSLFTAITTFTMAVFVLSRNPRSKLYRIFFLYTISISAWSFPYAFMANVPTKQAGLILGHAFNFGVSFISPFFIHFVYILLDVEKAKRIRVMRVLYAIAILFTFFVPTRLMVADVVPKFGLNYFIVPGPLYLPYVIFWVGCIMYGLFKMFEGYLSTKGARRNQLKLLLFGSLLGYIGGAANFFIVFDIKYPLYPFGTYAVGIYIFIVGYGIIRYRLLDITVYMARVAIFLLTSMLVMAAAFGISSIMREFLVTIFGANWWYISIFLSVLLSSVGYALAIFMIKMIEEKRSRKIRMTQESIEEAGREMIEFGNIHRVAKVIPRFLIGLYKKNLGVEIEHVSIFIFDDKIGKFILEKSAGKKKLLEGKVISSDHAINKWFTTKRRFLLKEGHLQRRDIDVLRYEDIDYWMSSGRVSTKDGTLPQLLEGIKNEMNSLEASICIPSIHDDTLIGFLLLGNKSQGMYTQEELDIFSRLSTNAAAAFRVAQLTTTLKNTQMGLIASGQLAAIGRLATSAKHEVNNPLQGIYGSIQRTLSYLKGTEDGYKLVRERLDTHKGKLDNTFSDLLKNESIVGTEKISEIKERLKLIDRAFTIINERAGDDEKFAQNVGANIKNIEDFQAQLKGYGESVPEEKVKDQFDEMVLLLDTIKHILDNIKKLNQTMLTIIERGKIDCERITEVIEIMYHLPRPDAKDKSDFTLEELLEKSFYFVRFQTYWENLSDTPIEKDIPVDLPKIRGFIGHLAIMFLNIITNAYQAMTDAGLTIKSQRFIKISANVLSDEPDFIEIRVLNKGPLIPETDLERIFEAGFTTKKKGSGMGLSLCKAIVEFFNNGSIYARNIPDFGPEFVIKLPRAKEVDKNDT